LPDTLIVWAARMRATMGMERSGSSRYVDAVCSGEAKQSSPNWRRRSSRVARCAAITGVPFTQESAAGPPSARVGADGRLPVTDLDALPYPEYLRLFAQ